MIKRIFCTVLFAGFSVWAAEDSLATGNESRLDKIEQAVTKAISKAGINFGGEFRSQFLLSRVTGDAVSDLYRKDENVEYTSVDFDISARPNTAVQGRVILRLHSDWRNFFSSLRSPVAARWISVDGLIKNVFSYNIGDFKQKYSPLTLYSPDIDILYEPEIFAKFRRKAMNEVFLGDNQRVLQGLNFNFDAEIVPVFKEAHLNILGSRLRLVAPGGTLVTQDFETDNTPMDKYLVGANGDFTVIPDFKFGGSYLHIFDSRYTYSDSIQNQYKADTIQQKSSIAAGRGAIGTAPFIDPKKFNVTIGGEGAFSFDDSSWLWKDTNTIDTTIDTVLSTKTIKGKAAYVDLKVTLGLGTAGSAYLGFGYLYNESDFRNELAQSPTLLSGRIMNNENDLKSDGALYNTYDILYRDVFQFCPSEQASLNGLPKGPQSKIAYTSGLLTRDEIKDLALDPALYMVMPYGQATPNRKGFNGSFGADLINRALLLSGSFRFLDELNEAAPFAGVYTHTIDTASVPDDTLTILECMSFEEALLVTVKDSVKTFIVPKTNYFEFGAGLSLDVAKLGNWWPYPLVLSGSFKLSKSSNEGSELDARTESIITSNFINGGLYWTFWKSASLLGGIQLIKTVMDDVNSSYLFTRNQLHWAAGLEYKVKEGGTITGSFGFIDVTHEDEADAVFNSKASDNDFRQWQTDLYLTVNF